MILKATPDLTVYGPYLRTYRRGQSRRQVVLKFSDGRTTSMAYARWLMQDRLGRPLLPGEHVDHVDENALNDDLANFQLLSLSENVRKSRPPAETITFDCPVCGEPTTKRAAQVRANRKRGMAGPFCGKQCARRNQAGVAQLR